MRLRENSRSASAVATFLPRMSCATRLSFCGLTRSMRATALASLSASARSLFFLLMVASQPYELRQDGRAPSPAPDHLVAARCARRLRLLEQIAVDERTFPNRTRHDTVLAYLFFRAWRLETMNLVVDLFRRVFLPLVGNPHGV